MEIHQPWKTLSESCYIFTYFIVNTIRKCIHIYRHMGYLYYSSYCLYPHIHAKGKVTLEKGLAPRNYCCFCEDRLYPRRFVYLWGQFLRWQFFSANGNTIFQSRDKYFKMEYVTEILLKVSTSDGYQGWCNLSPKSGLDTCQHKLDILRRIHVYEYKWIREYLLMWNWAIVDMASRHSINIASQLRNRSCIWFRVYNPKRFPSFHLFWNLILKDCDSCFWRMRLFEYSGYWKKGTDANFRDSDYKIWYR